MQQGEWVSMTRATSRVSCPGTDTTMISSWMEAGVVLEPDGGQPEPGLDEDIAGGSRRTPRHGVVTALASAARPGAG